MRKPGRIVFAVIYWVLGALMLWGIHRGPLGTGSYARTYFAVSLLFGLFFLAFGTGLFLRKEWARRGLTVFSGLMAVLSVFSLAVRIFAPAAAGPLLPQIVWTVFFAASWFYLRRPYSDLLPDFN